MGHDDDQPTTWTAATFGNQNNHSVAVRVDFGNASLLIPGDLEESAIPSVLAHYQGDLLPENWSTRNESRLG